MEMSSNNYDSLTFCGLRWIESFAMMKSEVNPLLKVYFLMKELGLFTLVFGLFKP